MCWQANFGGYIDKKTKKWIENPGPGVSNCAGDSNKKCAPNPNCLACLGKGSYWCMMIGCRYGESLHLNRVEQMKSISSANKDLETVLSFVLDRGSGEELEAAMRLKSHKFGNYQ